MSQKPITSTTDHPYCADYFVWMDQFEAERIENYEVDDGDIESTDDFFNRTVNVPLPDHEVVPVLSLDEFEEVFSNSPFVY